MATTDDRTWHTEYAKRSIASAAEDAEASIRSRIDWIRMQLAEAEHRLDRGEMPNTCGVLQSGAMELEMAVARLAALRDVAPAIKILTDEIDARTAAEAR